MKIVSIVFVAVLICISFATLAEAVVPAYITNAIIFIESSNCPTAISKDDCRGLGQIQEKTWYWICGLMGKDWSFDEAFDPEKNRQVTQYYLNWLEHYLQKKGRYSLELMCACYNAGPGSVRKYGWKVPPYPETMNYVKKIQKYLAKQARK